MLTWLLEFSGNDPLLVRLTTATGVTVLHLAAMKGHLPVCEYLHTTFGMDVRIPDAKGRTPLHLATAAQHAPVVHWLLAHGAIPTVADSDGKSALAVAQLLNTSATASGGTPSPALQQILQYLADAAAPPAAPTALQVLTLAEASDIADFQKERAPSSASGAETLSRSVSESVAALPESLPPPGFGITPTWIFLRWDAPPLPSTGVAPHEYAVQVSTKWALGWKDADILLTSDVGAAPHSASVTPHTYCCVAGLAPNSTYLFRVRARNANGWGPVSATFEATTPLNVAPAIEPKVKAAVAVDLAPAVRSSSFSEPTSARVAPPTAAATPPPPEPPKVVLPPAVMDLLPTCTSPRDLLRAAASAAVGGEDHLTPLQVLTRGVDASNHRTALHTAASHGRIPVLLWLIEQGAELGE